jgi:hypothetical protein
MGSPRDQRLLANSDAEPADLRSLRPICLLPDCVT